MRDFVSVVRALADENRIRALLALQGGELCVCELAELLALAVSTVSKHMSVLKQARLVESRRNGRWTFYRLAGRDAPKQARDAVKWACRCLSNAPQIREDARRLREIRKRGERICRG